MVAEGRGGRRLLSSGCHKGFLDLPLRQGDGAPLPLELAYRHIPEKRTEGGRRGAGGQGPRREPPPIPTPSDDEYVAARACAPGRIPVRSGDSSREGLLSSRSDRLDHARRKPPGTPNTDVRDRGLLVCGARAPSGVPALGSGAPEPHLGSAPPSRILGRV